jgi:hypothetical protein
MAFIPYKRNGTGEGTPGWTDLFDPPLPTGCMTNGAICHQAPLPCLYITVCFGSTTLYGRVLCVWVTLAVGAGRVSCTPLQTLRIGQ